MVFIDLSTGMKRLHDTFVALAGRLQSVHQQVESHKEQYLNLRKYILKDPTDVFSKTPKQQKVVEVVLPSNNVPTIQGPTPFSTFGAGNNGMMMMAPQQIPNKPPPAYPTGNTSLSKYEIIKLCNILVISEKKYKNCSNLNDTKIIISIMS